MSSEEEHRRAAERHLAVADALLTSAAGSSWVPTARFYAALQEFEASVAYLAYHFRSHEERLCHLAAVRPKALPPYKLLKDLSEKWRYYGDSPSPREVQLSETWLRQFRAWLTS